MTVVRLHFADRQDPEAEHVSRDRCGRPMFRFVLEYPHLTASSGRDRTWTATIWAYDAQDAEARLEAIRRGGRLAGQVVETGSW